MAAELNNNLVLPPGAFSLGFSPPVDESVTVSSVSAGGGSLSPGNTGSLGITFTSTGNSNVTGAAIGFGTSTTPPSQIMAVPVNTNGASSGVINFQFAIDASICANLSQICHDIRCYEYAVVDGQKVSQQNINQIAFACGACDEPSCQDLLTNCQPPGPNGTPLGVVAYAASGDSDLHIIDPNGFDHYVGGPTGSGAQLVPGSATSANGEGWWVYLPGTYQVYITNNTSGQMIYAVNANAVNTTGTILLSESGTESGSQTPTWSFTIN